ncbi:7850_t:CDS:2 [Entrophospora sp. SA101]|nr:7850_t:CDS:2 [Entrophospora sp. SA101]
MFKMFWVDLKIFSARPKNKTGGSEVELNNNKKDDIKKKIPRKLETDEYLNIENNMVVGELLMEYEDIIALIQQTGIDEQRDETFIPGISITDTIMGFIKFFNYGAGNVRSLVNAVNRLGFEIKWVKEPTDILKADKLIFPGVGAFGSAMNSLVAKQYVEPLKKYISSGKPFMGICVALQTMFEGSEESPGVSGLGIIPGIVKKFDKNDEKSVPHMGWNEYGSEVFISSIQKDNIFCTQFHPEKSGKAGLKILKSFLEKDIISSINNKNNNSNKNYSATKINPVLLSKDHFTKRIIACLDVRTNDQGDLVVTKGDQYDVREDIDNDNNVIDVNNNIKVTRRVRNLGKPVDLARRYFEEGADEITFLNITSYRNFPLSDLPMLEILRKTSETVFVPLTIGGGIRDFIDPDGKFHSALDVAGEYFRSGADKVSIGSDAVYAVEKYLKNGCSLDGSTAIELISKGYGSQAVVISVDPKKVYVKSPEETPHHVIKTKYPGPNKETWCWYQCTVKGGRETRDVDVYQLVTICEIMGAGEILLNCIDKDGTNSGYDLELIEDVKKSVKIPIIASSGAGNESHFLEVFKCTGVEAALAAGIFHRKEVPIEKVKKLLKHNDILIRNVDNE